MKNPVENLSEKIRRLRLFMQNNPDYHNKPDYYLAMFYLGPKPKLGKNKTRKKIQESNQKYQRKLQKLEAENKLKREKREREPKPLWQVIRENLEKEKLRRQLTPVSGLFFEAMKNET